MATVTATFAPGAGYDNITLTSWAGDASFSPAPVAGGQIEHVDTISVDATGVVTGSDGTYTLLYISPTGAAQAVSYTIANPDVVDPIIDTLTATGTDPDSIAVSFNSNEDNGTSYFFATAAATTETAPAIKAGAQGSQAVTATGAQSLTLTLATGTWYIHALHEDAAGNPSNILVSDSVTLAEIVESATTTAVFSGGADYTTATLGAGFDASTSAFQQWTGGEPAAGWQIETLTAEGWFDEDGQYWKPAGVADGIQDVWVIQPDGVVTVEQFDNTGLATVPDEGVVIDSVSVPNAGTYTPGETLTFTVNCNEAAIVTGTPGLNLNIGGSARQANYASGTGTVYLVFDYTVQVGDNDANGIAVTSLSLNDGTIKDEAGNDASLTLNSVGDTSGVLVDGTEAVPVPPTISTALPDLSLNEGDPVDINLGSYFTGAVSYGATGLPAGLTLSGSVISGTAQVGSATVTVTATNTDGSVSDAFGLTVTAIEEAGPIEVQREYSIDAGLSGLPKSQAFIFYQGDRVQITIVHDFDLSDKVLRYRQAEKVGLPARLKLDFSDNVIVFTTEETGLMTASAKVWQVILRQGESTVVVAEGTVTVKPRIKDE